MMKLPTINRFCRWLCFGKVKNIYGCYIGFFIALPFALSFGIVFGLDWGGGFVIYVLHILFDLDSEKTPIVKWMIFFMIILGAMTSVALVCLPFLAIGTNIGNLIGYLISKAIKRYT